MQVRCPKCFGFLFTAFPTPCTLLIKGNHVADISVFILCVFQEEMGNKGTNPPAEERKQRGACWQRQHFSYQRQVLFGDGAIMALLVRGRGPWEGWQEPVSLVMGGFHYITYCCRGNAAEAEQGGTTRTWMEAGVWSQGWSP